MTSELCSPASDLQPQTSGLRGLRVCFIAGTLGQGGAERQLYYLLKCLKTAGSEVSLLCLTQGEHWEEPVQELGIKVEWVGQSSSRLARLAKMVTAVRRLKPQVIQSQHFYTNLYSALSACFSGGVSIGAIRSNGFSELASNGRFFGPLHLRLPKMLAANSQAAIQTLIKMRVSKDKLFYLPNVIDTKWFSPGEERKNGPQVILGVGRLVQLKRFDRFLHILAEMRQTFGSQVKGVIAGDGPARPKLEALAQELGLIPEGVEFAGSVLDIRPYFQTADILLVTSEYEGTPNVVMEAMACGVPVVATNVGGSSGLIQNGITGFLFEPDHRASPMSALKRLVSDRQLGDRIAQKARQFIERDFSLDRLPQVLAEFYTMAARPNGSGCSEQQNGKIPEASYFS